MLRYHVLLQLVAVSALQLCWRFRYRW